MIAGGAVHSGEVGILVLYIGGAPSGGRGGAAQYMGGRINKTGLHRGDGSAPLTMENPVAS